MKICYFLPWYSPAGTGGTEIYMVELAKKMLVAGTEVIMICPGIRPVEEHFFVAGIPVIASPSIHIDPGGKTDSGEAPPADLAGFKTLLANIAPDILHFHCFWPKHIFYLETAKEMGIITLITPHLAAFSCLRDDLLFKGVAPCNGTVTLSKCTTCLIAAKAKNRRITAAAVTASARLLHRLHIPFPGGSSLTRLLSIPQTVTNRLTIFRRIGQSADAVISVMPWYEKLLLANGFPQDKIKTIRTTVISNREPGMPSSNDQQPLKVVFAGRQTHAKGLHLLFHVVPMFTPAEISLDLFGAVTEGLFDETIEKLRAMGYQINQHGEVPREILVSRLQEMDVLCFPSTCVEMCGLVILEAFASGIPAIGSNLGGPRDLIIDGQNGFQFQAGDARDLADKLRLLVGNRSLVEQLKRSCRTTLQLGDIGPEHVQLYQELMAKGTSFEINA